MKRSFLWKKIDGDIGKPSSNARTRMFFTIIGLMMRRTGPILHLIINPPVYMVILNSWIIHFPGKTDIGEAWTLPG